MLLVLPITNDKRSMVEKDLILHSIYQAKHIFYKESPQVKYEKQNLKYICMSMINYLKHCDSYSHFTNIYKKYQRTRDSLNVWIILIIIITRP